MVQKNHRVIQLTYIQCRASSINCTSILSHLSEEIFQNIAINSIIIQLLQSNISTIYKNPLLFFPKQQITQPYMVNVDCETPRPNPSAFKTPDSAHIFRDTKILESPSTSHCYSLARIYTYWHSRMNIYNVSRNKSSFTNVSESLCPSSFTPELDPRLPTPLPL